jgi:hypothetical protein
MRRPLPRRPGRLPLRRLLPLSLKRRPLRNYRISVIPERSASASSEVRADGYARVRPTSGTERGLLHLQQELGVALGLAHLLHE